MKNKIFKTLLISLSILNISIFTGCKNVSRETSKVQEINIIYEDKYRPDNIYSNIMLVDKCFYNADGTATVQFINSNGFVFGYKNNNQDISKGEYYSITMYTNDTNSIYDDIILNIKYERIDILQGYEEY